MIHHVVENFRNIASASLEDEKLLSVVLGANESGKSSHAGSIAFAFTGSAFGLKGRDVVRLIRDVPRG